MERKEFESLKLEIGEVISILDKNGATYYGIYCGQYDVSIPSFSFIEKPLVDESTIYLNNIEKIYQNDNL